MIVDGRGPLLVLVRGDHRLNEIKLQNALGAARPAGEAEEVTLGRSARAGLHRPGRARASTCSPTRRCAGLSGLVAGANEPDLPPARRGAGPRLRAAPGPTCAASRPATAARTAARSGSSPRSRSANIFKLGTRYSEPLGATYLDEEGNEQPIWMGSYGIGPARIVAAAVEQYADEQGISWPRALAPFDVELVTLGKEGEEARTVADRLYDELSRGGARRALRRPRPAAPARSSPTRSCSDARCGSRSASAGSRPASSRPRCGAASEQRSLPLEGAAAAVAELWREPPLTIRRLLGLDRSGGPPPETRRGQPLHPWTIPNAIGLVRIALLPVFLVLALDSGDGRDTTATILFAVIAVERLARRHGGAHDGPVQPPGRAARPAHRPAAGALGAIVAWQFELLPRWALRCWRLARRSCCVLTQVALRHGIDLKINMLGRWAVWPVMFALGLAMLTDTWVADACCTSGSR